MRPQKSALAEYDAHSPVKKNDASGAAAELTMLQSFFTSQRLCLFDQCFWRIYSFIYFEDMVNL